MLQFIAENAYVVLIMAIIFMYMYAFAGEDIIFFRKKHEAIDPKANEKLEKALEKYVRTKDYKVMGRTTVEFGGTTYTFDAIMFAYFGTVCFTAAPQGGDIYGDLGSEDWTAVFQGQRTRFYSPAMAMNGSIKMLKDLYRAEKVKAGNTETIVVFTNNDANVAVARSLPVCHIKDLSSVLNTKYTADNGADITDMMEAIKKHAK